MTTQFTHRRFNDVGEPVRHPEPRKSERMAFARATGREYDEAIIVSEAHTETDFVWNVKENEDVE